MRRLDPTPAILEGFPFCIPRWEKQCADDYFKLGRTYRSGWGEISKVKQVRLYWHSEGVGLPTRVVNDIRSEGVAAERRVSVIKTARGLYFECVWTCGETWEMVLWLRFPSLQSSYSPWLLFIYFCFTKSMWYLFKGGGKTFATWNGSRTEGWGSRVIEHWGLMAPLGLLSKAPFLCNREITDSCKVSRVAKKGFCSLPKKLVSWCTFDWQWNPKKCFEVSLISITSLHRSMSVWKFLCERWRY